MLSLYCKSEVFITNTSSQKKDVALHILIQMNLDNHLCQRISRRCRFSRLVDSSANSEVPITQFKMLKA